MDVHFSRCMTIKANSKDMKEHIWINCVAIEVVSFPLHDDQSKQHRHEGAHLDQSCRHPGCFFPAA